MSASQQLHRRASAAIELQGHCPDLDSQRIVDSLSAGLTHLRDLLMVRGRDDVERKYGTDSMHGTSLASMERKSRHAKIEIEAYSCIVIDDEVAQSEYINDRGEWFLDWIFRLRLGEGSRSIMEERAGYYQSQTIEERRQKFVSVLQRSMPETVRAPLVLFRLFPRSVRILAGVAFGDPLRAQELRAEQASLLPAIAECHECHGRVLDNDEICRCCSNPVWNFAWLQAD